MIPSAQPAHLTFQPRSRWPQGAVTTAFLTAFLTVLLLSATPSQAQDPAPQGDDFQVNTTTTGKQFSPDVAMDSAGNFVVTWSDFEGSQVDARAALFASDGSPIGDDFVVNGYTTEDQRQPKVARSDAGFVIVWSGDPNGNKDDVHARRFEPDGTPIGDDFLVATDPNFLMSIDIAMDPQGAFVVVWTDSGNYDIRGRRFASDGSPAGDEFAVSAYSGSQHQASVEFSNIGDFVVTWSGVNAQDPDFGIKGRRFGSDGAAIGDEFLVNTYTTGGQFSSRLAFEETGEFMVTWNARPSGGSDYSIYGRRFTSDANPVGDQFQIGSYTTGEQSQPQITRTGAGEFLVVWEGSTAGTDGHGISGQFLDSTGAPQGPQFQINTYTTQRQEVPVVLADASGDFIVAWQSEGSAGTDVGSDSIQARRFRLTGDVGDLVWIDSNVDGIQDEGEAGLEGVTVELLSAPDQLVASTTTDADGAYLFEKVPAGDYFIRVTPPAGFVFSPQSAGADTTVDSDVDALGESGLFSVVSGEILREIDAGGTFTAVGDRVWLDANADGIQDGPETGASGVTAGVTVTLFDANGGQVDQVQTDADGTYLFDGLAAGEYYLGFTAPPGYRFTTRDVGGDDAVDSDVSSDGFTVIFHLDGSADRTWDAGLVPTTATIGDRVWLDANLNGIQDGGEAGFAGVTVELFTAAGVSQGTTMSGADGSYKFADVAEGSYYLAFSEPAGFCYTMRDQGSDDGVDSDVDPVTFTTPTFSLSAGDDDLSRDAGLVPDASVGNRVWLDDGDGIQDGGELGVESVTVNLYDTSDQLVDSTTTDSTGAYAFSPGPGTFYLEFVLPSDMAFAPRDQGNDDAADSDVDLGLGTTSPFTLGPGQVDVSRDAGLEPAVIGNQIWFDENADGRRQPGEVGIAGITVRLLDETGLEVAQTSTGTDGIYQFLGIASGMYRVEVVPPVDGVFSTQNVGSDDLVDSDIDPATGRTELFEYTVSSASRSWDAGLRILPLFADGFESGTMEAWSEILP